MTKWKDTARAKREIIKKDPKGEDIIIREGTLLVIEDELPKDKYLVSDTSPEIKVRRRFSVDKEDVVLEDYGITKEINIHMLLADGWDAQDLLRNRDLGLKK